MGRFASPSTQAGSVMKSLQGSVLRSVGTVRNYEQALTRAAEWAQKERIKGGLRGLTPAQAAEFLHKRMDANIGQKTLDMERQAIQCMMQNVTGQLQQNEKLEIVKSIEPQHLTSRTYTQEQIKAVADAQNAANSLATEIAAAAGLRAHELLTLERIEDRAPSDRPAHPDKFSTRENDHKKVSYTVHGKGGLVREVQLPKTLSNRLEERRLDEPKTVVDRGVNHTQHYDISGGKKWSNSFSEASKRVLGWSNGAHGLRHAYAQSRVKEMQHSHPRETALEIVSQEMGHFRPEITEVYLR